MSRRQHSLHETTSNINNIPPYPTYFLPQSYEPPCYHSTDIPLYDLGYAPGSSDYLESSPPVEDLPDFQYMHIHQQNPPVRIHQSTPGPGDLKPSFELSQSTIDEPTYYLNLQPYTQPYAQVPSHHFSHKRASSSSSIGSAGPPSPYTPHSNSLFPRVLDHDSLSHPAHGLEHPYDLGYHQGSIQLQPSSTYDRYPQHYISSQPGSQDLSQSVDDEETKFGAQMAIKRAFQEVDEHGMNTNNAPTGSKLCREESEGSKMMADPRSITPKLDRTMSDIYQDELYNPASVTSAPPPPRPSTNQNNLLSPYSAMFSKRLRDSNNEHISAQSGSPIRSETRAQSPYRQTSEYATEDYVHPIAGPTSPARFGSAAQLRQRQKAETDAIVYAQHHIPPAGQMMAPKTISPKEALLDFNDTEAGAKMPLFPQENPRKRIRAGTQPSSTRSNNKRPARGDSTVMANGTQNRSDNMGTSRRPSPLNLSVSSGPAQPRSDFTFIPPSIPTNAQMAQQYPFLSQSRRQSSSLRSTSDQAPEFPSHLTSMESTKSESGHTESSIDVPRPSNTITPSGSFVCASPGCTNRFESAVALQAHGRDEHRQSTPRVALTPQTPGSGHESSTGTRDSPTASSSSRNNQSGTHKCERINPSTGKPCNTAFSRSYDLTRHEDTIHNNRKQKVRCHLCTEEKTFSRNDALTRHMRVVHPDVDFPGKNKRRGQV